MASEARREAARIVIQAIDDWCVRYMEGGEAKVSVEARLELERLKDSFASVAASPDPHVPDGWTPGSPMIGECSCDACVAKKVAKAKAEGRLKDPKGDAA